MGEATPWMSITLLPKSVRTLLDTIRRAKIDFITTVVIATVHTASAEDVDLAVKAASEAFETTWGLNVSGAERGRLLYKFADVSLPRPVSREVIHAEETLT
jgi:acyl-CoA reductase-like NAD-dependent aldehyde dehydrogenase